MNEASVPILDCIGVSKVFGDNYALIEVSTRLNGGSIKALLGPNGAGKSTLLGVCSSRITPSEGQVLFMGRDQHKAGASFRRSLGIVSHQIMLYEALTGYENLAFFASVSGFGGERSFIETQLDKVGLGWAKDRKVEEYSRGMQQRLTIARALINSPQLLLMDEPFTGLDRAGVDLVTSLIVEAKNHGAAVLVSSHDLSTLSEIADAAVVLRQGRAVFDDGVKGDLGRLYTEHLGDGP